MFVGGSLCADKKTATVLKGGEALPPPWSGCRLREEEGDILVVCLVLVGRLVGDGPNIGAGHAQIRQFAVGQGAQFCQSLAHHAAPRAVFFVSCHDFVKAVRKACAGCLCFRKEGHGVLPFAHWVTLLVTLI